MLTKITRHILFAILFISIIFIFRGSYTSAHSGRTNSSGCHNDYISGGYHCHNSGTIGSGTTPTVTYTQSTQQVTVFPTTLTPEIRSDPTLVEGQSRTEFGQNGLKEVTYSNKYVNGLYDSRTIVSEKIIKASTPYITYKGTKKAELPKFNPSTSWPIASSPKTSTESALKTNQPTSNFSQDTADESVQHAGIALGIVGVIGAVAYFIYKNFTKR